MADALGTDRRGSRRRSGRGARGGLGAARRDLAQLGVEERGAAAPETEDIVRTARELHETVDRWRGDGPATKGELTEAFDEARDTFEYLVSGRHESEDDAS
jgi:hypothetical protein